MSMLAEKKRKQKWSLNPRGKEWTEDTSKFGQKLMEKMGWKSGKGLGANENGRTDIIKVSYKNDSRGMGFKEQTEQWTEHDSNFSELLKKLSGGDSHGTAKINVKSLEEKSQKSRARVHYKKFTRGKDLTRYSEKDLANIFGKRSLKEVDKKVEVEEKNNVEEKDGKTFGIETIEGGSMADYFKKKLPGFNLSNGYSVGSNGVLKRESESEDERPSFGMGYMSNDCKERLEKESFVSNIEEDSCDGFEKEVSNNKEVGDDEKKSTFVSYLSEDNMVIPKWKKKNKKSPIEGILNKKIKVEMETPTKLKLEPQEGLAKKKKKSKKGKVNIDLGVSNPAFDPLFHQIPVEKHLLNTIEESLDETTESNDYSVASQESSLKIDKKQKKMIGISQSNQVDCEETDNKLKNKSNDSSSISGESNLKMGKKQKKKNRIHEQNQVNCEQKLEKKRKKEKHQLNGYTNPDFDQESLKNEVQYEGEFRNPFEIKIKKRKLQDYTENDFAHDNPNFDPNCSTETKKCDVVFEKSKVKERNKSKNGHINSDLDQNSVSNEVGVVEDTENPYEIKIKKKQSNFAADNPNFDANGADEANGANEAFEVKRKDKKKKKHKDIEVDESKKRKREEECEMQPVTDEILTNDIDCDIMLNVVTETAAPSELRKPNGLDPIIGTVTPGKIPKRRKSVRFSDVNEERIIPNYTKDHEMNLKYVAKLYGKQITCTTSNGILNKAFDVQSTETTTINGNSNKKHGLDNAAFSEQSANIEENLVDISKTLDNFQAEIENDLNEAKNRDLMVGAVGSNNETHVKTKEGVVLAFTRASFGKSPSWITKSECATTAKKSYKHLIKGDILLGFKNCNLHHVSGYATKIEKEKS